MHRDNQKPRSARRLPLQKLSLQKLRWYLLGLGVVLMTLVGCRTARYTLVGSGGGVQLGPVDIELRSFGQRLPCFTHNGQFYVVGSRGMGYGIWIRNRTPQRLEVVVSVDGRDVITGKRGQPRHRGYILNPYRFVNITGYRTSLSTVASFRFSSIHRSYSSRKGSSWFRVGSIVVSVYNERGRRIYRQPLVQGRRYSNRPSILRKRGYAATRPRAGARPRIVRKRRMYPHKRYKLSKRRAAPRHSYNMPRSGNKFAPPPSTAGKSARKSMAPRPASPSPSPGLLRSRRPQRSRSDDSHSVRRVRPSSRAPSYGQSLGGAARQRRSRRESHGYRTPAPPEGLGTAFGERRYAPARYTSFVRASSAPSYVLKIMYNNCAAYRYIGLCTPWCPCYRRPAPKPRYVVPHDPSVP